MIAKKCYQIKWAGAAVVAVRERGIAPSVESDYITLAQAVEIAGYSSKSTLHKAAREGRLKTIRIGPHTYLTTRRWLEEYLAGIRASKSHRGRPRSGDGPSDA